MKQTDNLIDVHAVAYGSNGDYQIKVVEFPPDDLTAYAKVIEPIDEGYQLVLWVPEGTPGNTAQNLATHFVPEARQHIVPTPEEVRR